MMYGQMTAGSWIYIGTQGILQGTYETFAAVARKRFGGTLRGRLVVTAGLGGMGGAQPLAVTMNEGCALCVEVDLHAHRAADPRALPRRARRLARRRAGAARRRAQREGRALSIGLLGNAAEVLPELVAPRRRARRRDRPDERARPAQRLRPGRADASSRPTCCARADPDEYLRRVGESVARARRARSASSRPRGAEAFDYGNALRGVAAGARRRRRVRLSRASSRPTSGPLFCEGKGPFRWVALSGDPADIAATDAAILDLFGDQEHIRALDRAGAASASQFQGLPARICWLGYGERHLAGLRFNEMVASGELSSARS